MALTKEQIIQLAKEVANYIPEFQATQRRKERNNIVQAFYKLRKGEDLKKREIEAYKRYVDFIAEKWKAEGWDSHL